MSGPGISSTQDPVTGYNIIIMLQVRREKIFQDIKNSSTCYGGLLLGRETAEAGEPVDLAGALVHSPEVGDTLRSAPILLLQFQSFSILRKTEDEYHLLTDKVNFGGVFDCYICFIYTVVSVSVLQTNIGACCLQAVSNVAARIPDELLFVTVCKLFIDC